MMVILALSVGAAFGLLYLGALWGAVRLLASGRGVVLFAAMALLRAGLLLGALWLAAALGATALQMALALSGFLVMRLAATTLAKSARTERSSWR